MTNTIASFKHVSKTFMIAHGKQYIKAVEDISFNVNSGETLAIVGESGSGKSTLARMLMKLDMPSTGSILVINEEELIDIAHLNPAHYYRYVQMVFQDPYASLNSRKKVWDIVTSCLAYLDNNHSRQKRRASAAVALDKVGLGTDFLDSYPNQLSGGQRQRVSIARALIYEPKIVVLDEPLSALDASVQAQIINLLLILQKQFNLTYIFISHDLSIVRHIADRVVVMKSGRLIDQGKALEIIDQPKHPYTRSLVEASFSFRPEPLKQKGLTP